MSLDSVSAERLAKDAIGQSFEGWLPDRILNHGKSAVVLHATKDGAEAAVKVFDRDLVERFKRDVQLERIRRERTLIGKNHPNLVRIFGGGYDESLQLAYVVMEFIPYTNLFNVLQRVPRDRIWPILAQVASAARFLESHDLSHRDIKPDNIAISDDFQKAILLDLGVLKPLATDQDEKSITDLEGLEFIGTLQYSPPEFLFRRERDDAESWRAITFYQLGAVLHDLVMGKRLFSDAEGLRARLVESVRSETPPVEAVDLPPRLIQLAKTCLLKSPELRMRYLTWDSFTEASETETVTDLKQMIRARIGGASEAASLQGGSRAAHDRRSVIHVVQSIQTKLGDLLRHERADNEVFPPMEAEEKLGSSPEKGSLVVTFAASPDLLLPHSLCLCFELILRDRASLAVTIMLAGALIESKDSISDADREAHAVEFFDGVFEDDIVATRLRTILLRAVNESQALGRSATPRWLDTLRGGKTEL